MKRAGLLLLLLSGLWACGPEDVVVAFVPEGGPLPPRGRPCTSNADCPPADFCERLACADAAGRCVRRPALCEPQGPPVCGCNGVTYLNECYRRANGVSGALVGECTAGATCDAQTSCPDGAFCFRLLPVCQPPPVAGRCWWTPPVCPAVGAFSGCASAVCTDLCTAVRSELPHEPAPGFACP